MNHANGSVSYLQTKMKKTLENQELNDMKMFIEGLRKEYEKPKNYFLRSVNKVLLFVEKRILDYFVSRKVDNRILIEKMTEDLCKCDLEEQFEIIESIGEYVEDCLEYDSILVVDEDLGEDIAIYNTSN
ncbi:hypothetical protein P9027_30860 [Bacillus thuringiensis]|uniref:hypothetical protein n=1 Tax=Bacillus thuringiensis TaxID=1428 RepID=UPI002DC04D64|nr:hypothetical protein [Bacillus thuringiensis]MEC3226318.1 hypothetical protein [Bacillus thuringiensis]MED2055692.1 hypothetical protein [Bacillus thuringiensis]MED2694149.1 hypothetical protein [Bacillus thuringiensis]